MLGAVSIVMETSSGVGCQEQPNKKEKMSSAKCPPPTPNLITQYFKSPPKPDVTSPRPSGILGYFKPMGKTPSQQKCSRLEGAAHAKVASPKTTTESESEKNSSDAEVVLKNKTTKSQQKKVTKAKNKKPTNKELEEVKDQGGSQEASAKEAGKVKEPKKTGIEYSVCSTVVNGNGSILENKRKSKKRKKSDVLNSSVDDFEAQPKKASKVSVSAAPVEDLTASQGAEARKADKRAKVVTETKDTGEGHEYSTADVKRQNSPLKDTKQSLKEDRNSVGRVKDSETASESLIDGSIVLDGGPGDDSVMMISYHDYLANSQSEEEEEENEKIVKTEKEKVDKEDSNNTGVEISYSDFLKTDGVEDSNHTEAEISYSDFLKSGAEEVSNQQHTNTDSSVLTSGHLKDIDESSKEEIPYEDFVKNMAKTTTEDEITEPCGELLARSPNSSGQGKIVTTEAQVHRVAEETVSKQLSSGLLKQGGRASTPKTKGRKKSNVVVDVVDFTIEESNDNSNSKKLPEERMKENKKSIVEVDPETRAREEEIKIQNRKNFMANFRQPGTKKKVPETERMTDEPDKEEEDKDKKEDDTEKVDKKMSSVKSSTPSAKNVTRARKPAAKKVSVDEGDEGNESPPVKKTGRTDRKNAKCVTKKDTTGAKGKNTEHKTIAKTKKPESETTAKMRKKKAEKAKEAETVKAVEPDVEETPKAKTRTKSSETAKEVEASEPEETPTRTTRSGRRCVYRAQLLSVGSPSTPSPIRLRLTRVSRRSQGKLDNQGDFTPKGKAKNAKVTKAQELVQKAKAQKNSKAKSKSEKHPQPKVTRPKRQAAKTKSPEVVEIIEESPKTKRVKERKGVSKVQPAKGKGKVCTPKKAAKVGKDGKPLRSFLDVLGKKKISSPAKRVGSPRKPAAMFAIFGKKAGDGSRSSPVTVLDDDSRGSGSENSMDEATFAARRTFLMSGIPDRLRKQITISAAQAQAYMYPPFPAVSHVLQRDMGIPDGRLDFWALPPPKEGRVPTLGGQTDWECEGKVWKEGLQLGTVTTCKYTTVQERQPRISAAPLDHAVCKSLVAEIGTQCPGVAVRRVYKRYRARYMEHQGQRNDEQVPSLTTASQPAASQEPAASKDKKGNKRKRSEVIEGQDHNTNKRKKTEEQSEGQKVEEQPEGQKVEEQPEGQKVSPEEQEPRRRSRLSRKAKMADRVKGQEATVTQKSDGEGRRRSGRTKRNSSSGGEREEPRRNSRRVARQQEEDRKGESEEEVKIVQEAPAESAETNEDGVQDSLWTDKYQPRSSSELIGNTGAMRKLKGWLQEWKIRADKEMRRLLKEMKKQKQAQKKAAKKSGSQGSGDWWDDDDSDFDISDDGDSDYNEEEEEDGLCNTMLVLGPTGIGKTSAVYACAQELGYKVFEVNAASLRSGKQVLTQLREATQSHQVSKQAQTGGAASLFKTSLTPQKAKPGGNKGSLPSSFVSFFKKTEDGKKDDDKGAAGAKKVRRSLELGPSAGDKGNKKEKKTEKRRSSKGGSDKKSLDKPAETKTAKEPTRAMTSLILFEEVDVVFEEDKGFLPAINSLMMTTKRPIILTTSDATFPARFEGRYEELTFKQPLQPVVTSHLQLLCLAENLPTRRADVEATLALCRGDIRRTMLALQFWAESGGGMLEKTIAPDLHKAATNTSNQLQSTMIEESSQSQTCDTVDMTADPSDKTTMVVGPLPDDDVTMDTDSFHSLRKPTASLSNRVLLPADDTCDSCPSSQEVAMATVAMDAEAVSVHAQCMESVLGTHNVAACRNQLLQVFMTSDSDPGSLARQISLAASCQWQGRNLLCHNVEQLLPLPTTPWIRPKSSNSSAPLNVPLQEKRGKQNKRDTLLDSSLFDAEDLPSSPPKDAIPEQDKMPLPVATEGRTNACNDEAEDCQSSPRTVEKEDVLKQKLIFKALVSLCDLSENKSYLDSHIGRRSLQREGFCKIDQSAWRAKVKSGLTDSVRTLEESDWRMVEMEAELRAAVEVMGVRQCARTVEKLVADSAQDSGTIEGKLAVDYAQDLGTKDCWDELTLPVVGDAGTLKAVKLQEETQAQLSMFSTRSQTMQGVMSALPSVVHGQHRAIALDYLPALRSICTAEKLREASKLKRRFLHYLDNNGLSLKPSVMNALAQEF